MKNDGDGGATGWMPIGGRVPLRQRVANADDGAPQERAATPPAPSPQMGNPAVTYAVTFPRAGRRSLAPAVPPSPPQAPLIVPGKCPGPIEMPDGRVIDPDDPITFKDFCSLLPFISEAMGLYSQVSQAQPQGLAPGMTVPIVGQPQAPGALPIGTPSQFGPATGPAGGGPMRGGGGGGFIASGGGGPGPRGLPGPMGLEGLAGPAGAAGPAGPGSIIDFTVKTDGDFTAGPGTPLVPVPGTLVNFVTSEAGPVLFLVQATLGCGFSQSAKTGLVIDGVTMVLSARSLSLAGGGNNEFMIGQPLVFAAILAAGVHTVEFALTGPLFPSDCNFLGVPSTVSATPTFPLSVVVVHR